MDRVEGTRFRIRPGLPPYGPLARSFPPRFAGREGLVIEFMPDTPGSWMGNFAPGLGGYDGVHLHPNLKDVVIINGGEAYVVDPEREMVREEVEGAVFAVWEVTDPVGLVFDRQGLAFERISVEGLVWHTRRLSWDGFRNVVVETKRIEGEAWSPFDSKWIPFVVDLATGRAEGGSFWEKDTERWERLGSAI
jgi:hypothetical protein